MSTRHPLRHTLHRAVTLLAAIAALAGGIDPATASDLQVSGFATLGAAYTRSDELEFARVGIPLTLLQVAIFGVFLGA